VDVNTLLSGSGCPSDMTRVADFCIDRYEASVWSDGACDGSGTQYGNAETDDYPQTWPANGQYSQASSALYACSIPAVEPSGWVTYFRATAACAESGKRLCTNAQWQTAALGTPDTEEACPVNTAGPVQTDAFEATCQSRWGVVQMVGNMQEFTSDWVVNGVAWYDADGQKEAGAAAVPAEWPEIAGVDDRSRGVNGNALAGVSPTLSFVNGSPSVLLRSGSYGQGAHAGPLYVNGNVGPVTAFESGGFRCCATPFTLPGSIPPSSTPAR